MPQKIISKTLIPYFTIITLSFLSLFLGCFTAPEESADRSTDYIDKLEIQVSLGPSQDLGDLDKEDVFYRITNLGYETVTKVYGKIIFYAQDGKEVGRDSILFLEENKKMEGVAAEGKKVRWQSLAPGQSMNDGYEFIYLLGGEPELREALKPLWDGLTASAEIEKVEILSH